LLPAYCAFGCGDFRPDKAVELAREIIFLGRGEDEELLSRAHLRDNFVRCFGDVVVQTKARLRGRGVTDTGNADHDADANSIAQSCDYSNSRPDYTITTGTFSHARTNPNSDH
jgi:hypothetical protein